MILRATSSLEDTIITQEGHVILLHNSSTTVIELQPR
jgi:hypothetical protein